MGTGTAVSSGDWIDDAKMNLKLEDLSNDEENTAFAYLRFRASGTLPAGTVAYAGRDNTNDVTVNALTGGAFNVAIAGTDEYTFDASAFSIASGNTLDFNAAAGAYATLLRDVNNNALLQTYATASAVNYLAVRNEATGNAPIFAAQGEANIGLLFYDTNNNELLRLRSVASAVTEVALVNAATGVRPTIRSEGEADRGFILASYDGTNSEEVLILAATASAVNEVTVTSAAATGSPDIAATGDDANVSLTLSTKGTGIIQLRSATTARLAVNNAYSATLYQATANYTLAWSDPAAARTLTIPDPLANDTFAFLAATQTLTNKTVSGGTLSGTLAGTPTFSGAFIASGGPSFSRAGVAASFENTTDGASVQVAIFEGNRATPAANDAMYLTLRLSDSAGNQDEMVRLTVLATDVTSTTEDAYLGISTIAAGTLTERLRVNNAYSLTLRQATFDLTLAWNDPAAARTITIADPGGAATLAYINQAQTHTVAHIFTGTPIFRSAVAATHAIEAENTNDAASVLVAVLEGDRATPADGDLAYISLRLSDSAGNQDEQARISWAATTVLDGATQDGDLVFSVLVNNVLTEHLRLDGSENRVQFGRPIYATGAGNGLQAVNTTDGASVQLGIFEGDRATPAANDEAYLTFRLSDSVGNQDEFARLTWLATDVTSASEDGRLELDLVIAGALTRVFYFEARTIVIDQATGDITLSFSDPAANRTITFPDPGANVDVVYTTTTQTLSGKTLSLSGDLTFSAALDIEVQTNTAATLQVNAGADTLLNVDSRNATDGVIVFTWDLADPTFASAAGSAFNMHRLNAFTVNLTGGVGVTAMNGVAMEFQAPTLAAGQATTVTTASTLYLRPITAGANMTITNSRMIDTSVAGCFLSAAGIWTDASSREHKTDIAPVDYRAIPGLLESVELVTYRRLDSSDGGQVRFGLVAEEAPDFLASPDHKGIAAQYVAGFALAGVKYTVGKLEELQERVASLERENAELRERVLGRA